MLIFPAISSSPDLSPLSSDMGSREFVDDNSLHNADKVPEETGDESPFLADTEQRTKLDETSVEMASVVDAVAGPVGDNWRFQTPAKLGKKSSKKKKGESALQCIFHCLNLMHAVDVWFLSSGLK